MEIAFGESGLLPAVVQDRLTGQVRMLAYVNREAQPEILRCGDPRFAQVRQYLEKISGAAGFDTRFVTSGDELLPTSAD